MLENIKNADILTKKYLDNKRIYESDPGYIEIFWEIKKKILKDVYNIEWNSPKDIDDNSIFN